MLELPKEFKLQIINRYSEKGQEWLSNIDKLIDKCVTQFELENTKLVEDLGMNIVLFSTSKKYGEVALKIGTPGRSFIYEMNIMQQYPQNCIPKCYYFSIEDRVMLQERLLPGYSLNNLNSREKRVEIFCNITNALISSSNDIKSFLTHENLFKEKIKYAHNNKNNFFDIMEMIDTADNIYDHIVAMNLPKYVLHDDLHHKNILKSKNGWKIIDPHGIVGEKVFETSQFIRDEIKIFDESLNNLEELVSLIETYLDEDRYLIMQSLYVNIIAKIIGYTQNNYDTNAILYNIELTKKILKFIKNWENFS